MLRLGLPRQLDTALLHSLCSRAGQQSLSERGHLHPVLGGQLGVLVDVYLDYPDVVQRGLQILHKHLCQATPLQRGTDDD